MHSAIVGCDPQKVSHHLHVKNRHVVKNVDCCRRLSFIGRVVRDGTWTLPIQRLKGSVQNSDQNSAAVIKVSRDILS